MSSFVAYVFLVLRLAGRAVVTESPVVLNLRPLLAVLKVDRLGHVQDRLAGIAVLPGLAADRVLSLAFALHGFLHREIAA